MNTETANNSAIEVNSTFSSKQNMKVTENKNIAPLCTLLNNVYTDNSTGRSINFKQFTEKSKVKDSSLVLDISSDDGLLHLKEVINNLLKKFSPEDTVNFNWDNIIKCVHDAPLKGFLSLSEFMNDLFPTLVDNLKLPSNDVSFEDVNNAIKEYFGDREKMCIKVFNKYFPHDLHDPSKPTTNINVKYLQRLCKHHDVLLPFIVENLPNLSDTLLLKKIHEECLKDLKESDKQLSMYLKHVRELVKDYDEKVALNYTQKELIDLFKEFPRVNVVNGKFVQLNETLETLDKETFKKYASALKYLFSCSYEGLRFMQTILEGHKRHPEVDLKECLSNYNDLLSKLTSFTFKSVDKDDVTGFMNEYVRALKLVDELKEVTSFTIFNNDKVQFRFPRAISDQVKVALKDNVDFSYDPEKYKGDVLGLVKRCCKEDLLSTSAFAKIGSVDGIENIPKPVRVALGLYIINKCKDFANVLLQVSTNKKLTVLVK